MSDKSYPSWQAAIREAQAKQAELYRIAAEKEEAEKKEEQRKSGENLNEVLALLGIELPTPPDTNPYTFNGFTFRLKDWDASTWEYNDGQPCFEKRGGNETLERIRYTLFVSKPRPSNIEADDWNFHSIELTCYWRDIEGDWTAERAALANALDDIQERWQTAVEDYEDRRQSKTYALPQAATPEERLLSALRDLILSFQYDDTEGRFGNTEDHGY